MIAKATLLNTTKSTLLNSTKASNQSLVMNIKEAGSLFGKGGKYYGSNRFRNEGGYTTGVALLLLFLVIFLIIFGPLITIWALNGLFGLTITYTLKHWFCALLLISIFQGSSSNSRKN